MADTYKIYQLHDTPEYHGIRFSSMEENKNENLNINDYDLVYQGNISDFNSDFGSEYLLEEIYRKFNIDRPEDFKGYSLSMSDVVVMEINNEQKAYYCDRIGFQEMPEFFAEQNEILFRIEMNGEIETYKANGITAEEILNITANSENPYSELMNLGQPISDLDYAVFQQSDKFTVSVDVNFDENEATIYTVNNGKGGIDEGDRTDDNVSFQYVKISDFKDLPNERKWIDYSANYDMKIDGEYIEGLTGKENLLANGGVFFRETEPKNEFEYVAIIIEDNNTPFPCHGYINLDEYRDNEDFVQYAKEENMTVDELINTGTFAASWVLENNTDEFVFTADRDKDAGQFIDEMGLLENTDEKENSFNYETAFAEMLDTMEFSLVKYEDGSFGLHDYTGANLGNIEGDRFDNATEIIDRLT